MHNTEFMNEKLALLSAAEDKIDFLEADNKNFAQALSELGDFLEAQTSEPVLWLAYQTIVDEHQAWATKYDTSVLTYKDLYTKETRKNKELLEMLDCIQSDIKKSISECEGIDHGNK